MKISIKVLAVVAVIIFASASISAIGKMKSKARVQRLLAGGGINADPVTRSREEDLSLYQGQLRLNSLGGRINGASSTAEVTTFLNHPSWNLQTQSLRLLGRFEDPESLPSLKEKVAHDPFPVLARIALARVETRNLHGQAKLDEITRSIGLSCDDVFLLSQKVNDPLHAHYGGSAGDFILEEMVDVLCSMARRGERIESLITIVEIDPRKKMPSLKRPLLNARGNSFLLLDTTQLVRIQAARFDEKDEIRFLLDYLGNVRGLRPHESNLADYIVGLGPKVPKSLAEKLDSISQHPKDYYGMEPSPASPGFFRDKSGLSAMMDLCFLTLDSQVMLKLRALQASNDKVLSFSAKETLTRMEGRVAYMTPRRS